METPFALKPKAQMGKAYLARLTKKSRHCSTVKIFSMQYLRNTSNIIRLVLVWFALSVGVAIASPMVQPKAMDMVCTSTGSMKLVVQGDEDGSIIFFAHLGLPLVRRHRCISLSVKY